MSSPNITTGEPVLRQPLLSGCKKPIWLLISVTIVCVIMLLPTPAGLTLYGKASLATFLFIAVVWASEAVAFDITGPLLITVVTLVAWGAGGMASGTAMKFALSGLSEPAVWLIFGVFILSTAAIESNLAYRLAYKIVARAGAKPRILTLAYMLLEFPLALLMPSITARAGFMEPICRATVASTGAMPIDKTLKQGKEPSQFAKLIYLSNTYAILLSGISFLTAATTWPFVSALLKNLTGFDLNWGYSILLFFPTAFILTIIAWLYLNWFFRPEFDVATGGQKKAQEELKKLGPMSTREKQTLVIIGIAIILWATDFIHHLGSTVIALGVGWFLWLFGIITWKQVSRNTPWGILVVLGAALAFGNLIEVSGAMAWLGKIVLNLTEGMPIILIFAILVLVSASVRSMEASGIALIAPLAPIIVAAAEGWQIPGADTVLLLVIGTVGHAAYLLPMEMTSNMVMYSGGYFESKDMLKSGWFFSLIYLLFWIITAFTYWKWIGLW
ncbi:MAG: DASS family sodium-coupled anion symporter [Desulfotomaculaceae bacterium]|nr:DASS family sodium-coupled anion symporter [Desulfotomaculaceae bacterium]